MKKTKIPVLVENIFTQEDGLSMNECLMSFRKWEKNLKMKTHTGKQHKENANKFSQDYMGQRLAGFCSQYSKILFYMNHGKESEVYRMNLILEGHKITHTFLVTENNGIVDPTISQFDKVDVVVNHSTGKPIKTGQIDGFFEFRHNVIRGRETYVSQDIGIRVPPKWFMKLIPEIISYDERLQFLNKWLIMQEEFNTNVTFAST